MRTQLISIAVVLAFTGLGWLAGQGPLSPPAAPVPSMKTLDQVEPRIDLATVSGSANAMHLIDQSGSYYLSGNLDVTTTNGIEIAASGVTVDLMGFNIFRSSANTASGTAILITAGGVSNVAIKNGHITGGVTYDSEAPGDQFTGPGFGSGISESADPNPSNVRVSHIHVSGCNLVGILLTGASNTAENCSVQVVGNNGIQAGEVSHCTAITCGGTAINATGNVTSSRGESVGTTGDGIRASGNVINSYGITSGDDAITASGNITNSFGKTTGTGTDADGIFSSGNVTNSYGESSGDDGIDATFTISHSRGSTTGTGDGLECNIAIGCTSFGGQSIVNKYNMP